MSESIAKFAKIHKQEKALLYAPYKAVLLTNRQLVFEREYEGERIWVAINIDSNPYYADFTNAGVKGDAQDLLNGGDVSLLSGIELAPYSIYYWKFK